MAGLGGMGHSWAVGMVILNSYMGASGGVTVSKLD